MNALDGLQNLRGLVHTEALALGFTFSLITAAILFWPSAPQKLEPRLRALMENRSSGRKHSGILPKLRNALQILGTVLALEAIAEKLSAWRWAYSRHGSKKHLQLKQAGLHGQQVFLYIEVIRLILSLSIGLVVFLLVTSTGFAAENFAQMAGLIIIGLAMGAYLPDLYIKKRIARRRAEFDANWEDAVGLLIICLEAGLSIEIALRRIARELVTSAPVLAEELIITVTELSLLRERRQAYQNLAKRIDIPSVQSVAIALVQAEKQGASISNSLRVISQSNREARLTRAETKAAALGPKMTIPMLLFFLPIIFVVIIAPVVLTADFNF